ncbi:MAG: hypothetical protein OEM82_09405, partial [Acidobacteriota bacterium]|nr:hypothetical protein [Acidobacteriota bacterium]
MIIELENYGEGLDWQPCFTLFTKSEYLALWEILGVPVQIVSRPKHLSALAKEYLNIPSPYTEVEAGYAVDLETLTISFRDHELAKLQWVFGEIAKFYSSKAAEELFRLGLRTFIDKKGKFWSIWIELLSGDLEIYTPVSGFLCQCKAPRFRTRLKYSVSVISQPSILRA